jgi:hypothetical protein
MLKSLNFGTLGGSKCEEGGNGETTKYLGLEKLPRKIGVHETSLITWEESDMTLKQRQSFIRVAVLKEALFRF